MSPRAQRLASNVVTDRFHWQVPSTPVQPLPLRPVAIHFAQSTGGATSSAETLHDVEAREMHFPSVTRERVAEMEKKAHAEGYAAGLRQGEADAARQVGTAMGKLAGTIQEVAALRPGILRRSERELVKLAVAMAERIVRRAVEVDPDLLLVIARVAMDRLGERAAATIHLHPADCEALSKHDLQQTQAIQLVADANVARGGCIVKSSIGEIDAGIEAQVHELSRELLGVEGEGEVIDGVVIRP